MTVFVSFVYKKNDGSAGVCNAVVEDAQGFNKAFVTWIQNEIKQRYGYSLVTMMSMTKLEE